MHRFEDCVMIRPGVCLKEHFAREGEANGWNRCVRDIHKFINEER
jgi:hypothetical protein